MTKIFMYIWIFLLLVNFILLFVKMFSISETHVKFGIGIKFLFLHFFVIMSLGYYFSVIEPFFLNGKEPNLNATILLLFSILGVYVGFSFRFQCKGKYYIWFNGLYIRKVSSDTIKYIIFYVKKGQTQKIKFVRDGKNITFRFGNYFEYVIYKFAHENKIHIKRKKYS